MKHLFILTAWLFAFTTLCIAQPTHWKAKKYFTIVNYNVENLFDTISAKGKMDNEFTPEGKKQWDTERYETKLKHLSKVISSINTIELPEIIGLIEIENQRVLNDLVNTELLKAGQYKIVTEEGPDPRGIDCALLYRPDVFTYHSHRAIEVRFPFANNQRTRDILYVKGLVRKDTVHLFVNHWSSRRGGQEKSEIKRVQCATVLKSMVDSLQKADADCKIFIMGDFNDNPSNKSLYEVLDAGRLSENKVLTNLMFSLYDEKQGTYFYNKTFDMLDNLLVTKSLINAKKGFRLYEPKGYIFKADFLTYTDKHGNKMPARSFAGSKYFGGYSDHFPVYTIFYEK